jgi:hypothetical protein
MNVVGKISLGLTAAVGLHLAGRAESPAAVAHSKPSTVAAAPTVDSSAADNSAAGSSDPYATIVARNIFGLVPVPPPPPPPVPPADPPPKITANGIMNVFGELEALFKVSFPAKGSTPAKDQSYMLSQGQRQDDIEVVKIDEPNGTITFDNNGTTQEIPLVPAGKGSGSGPAASGSPQPGYSPSIPPGSFGRPVPGPGNGPGNNNNNNTYNNTPAGNPQIYQPPPSEFTPEQNAVLIEANREAAYEQQQKGQTPNIPPEMFPTTPLTMPPPTTGNEQPK